MCVCVCYECVVTYQRECMAFVFRGLAISLRIMISRWVLLLQMVKFDSSLCSNSILWSKGTIFFFIPSFVVGCLGYSHALAVVNCTVISMGLQVPLSHADFISFGYNSRGGMAGSSIFSCLRNILTD